MRYLASLFNFKNPKAEAKHQLRECELELLEAQAAQEHWAAKVAGLKNRKTRLSTQVAADERETLHNSMATNL
jgi:hypothetical protein